MEPSPEDLVQAYSPLSDRRKELDAHLKRAVHDKVWYVLNARIGYEADFSDQSNRAYLKSTYPWLHDVSDGLVGFDEDKFDAEKGTFDRWLDSIDPDEFEAFLADAANAKEGESLDEDGAHELEQKETQRWLDEEGGSDLRDALHKKFEAKDSYFQFVIEQLKPADFWHFFQQIEMWPEREVDSIYIDEDAVAALVSEELVLSRMNASTRLRWGQTKRRSYRKFAQVAFTAALADAVKLERDAMLDQKFKSMPLEAVESVYLRLVPDTSNLHPGVPKWTNSRLDYGSDKEWFVTWDLSEEDWKSHWAIKENIRETATKMGAMLGVPALRRWKPPESPNQLKLRLPRRTRTEADHARALAIVDRLLEAKKPKQSSLPLEQPDVDPADIDPSQLVQMSYGDEKHVHENPLFRVIRVTSEVALKRYMGHAKVPPYNWQVGDYFLIFPQGRTDPYYWVRNDRDNMLSNVPENMREEVERVILKHYRKNFHAEDPNDSPDYDLLWPMFKLGGRSPMRHIIRKHVNLSDENTSEFAFHYGIHLLAMGRWRSALKYLDIKPQDATSQGYVIRVTDWDALTGSLFADTRDSDHRKTAEKVFSGEARDWFWEHQAYVDPEEVAENLNDEEWKLVRAHMNYMTLYPNGTDEEAVVMQPSVLAKYTNDEIVEWIKHQDDYDPDNELDELRSALKRIAAEVEIDSMESGMYNAATDAIEDALGSKGKWVVQDGKNLLEFIVPWSKIVRVYEAYRKANADWFNGGVWYLLMDANDKFEFSDDFSNYGKSFGEAVNKPDSGWHEHASFYLGELPETEPPSDPNQPELSLDEPTTPTQPNESLAIS